MQEKLGFLFLLQDELQLVKNWLMSQFQYLSFQVAKKESELVKRTKAVQKANDQLKTIQEMIENELADNKHSEYLLKVFKMRDASKSKVLFLIVTKEM